MLSESDISILSLYSIYTHFEGSTTEAFENIVGKGEIACNEQFLLFARFLLNRITVSPLVHNFVIISLFDAELKNIKLANKVKN